MKQSLSSFRFGIFPSSRPRARRPRAAIALISSENVNETPTQARRKAFRADQKYSPNARRGERSEHVKNSIRFIVYMFGVVCAACAGCWRRFASTAPLAVDSESAESARCTKRVEQTDGPTASGVSAFDSGAPEKSDARTAEQSPSERRRRGHPNRLLGSKTNGKIPKPKSLNALGAPLLCVVLVVAGLGCGLHLRRLSDERAHTRSPRCANQIASTSINNSKCKIVRYNLAIKSRDEKANDNICVV